MKADCINGCLKDLGSPSFPGDCSRSAYLYKDYNEIESEKAFQYDRLFRILEFKKSFETENCR